jgi:hypothetical protein
MKRQQWGQYAVALAILIVGSVWAGVPVSSLLIAGLVLVCPLMMLVMMRDDPNGRNWGTAHRVPGRRTPLTCNGCRSNLRRPRCTGETAWTAGITS